MNEKIINPPNTPLNEEYKQFLRTQFFNVCENRSVLEIAPFDGHHTEIIKSCNPSKLTLVEANPACNPILLEKFPNDIIVNDDIYNFYRNEYLVDVVICCGLLYHLHSPLYLLELIVNQSSPEYIIIDNVSETRDTMSTSYGYEYTNLPGNRFGGKLEHLAKFNCPLPLHVMDLAMRDMGYHREKLDQDLSRFNVMSKHGYIVMYKDVLSRRCHNGA
jgi:hypothetical protein